MMSDPYIGETVHYVARGSADGYYESACRAAIVVEVPDHGLVGDTVLFVMTPTGTFHDDTKYDPEKGPGTWHWPEGRSES